MMYQQVLLWARVGSTCHQACVGCNMPQPCVPVRATPQRGSDGAHSLLCPFPSSAWRSAGLFMCMTCTTMWLTGVCPPGGYSMPVASLSLARQPMRLARAFALTSVGRNRPPDVFIVCVLQAVLSGAGQGRAARAAGWCAVAGQLCTCRVEKQITRAC